MSNTIIMPVQCSIHSITASVTEPLELDVKDMDFKELMILTGLNGSGKTFLLKSVFALVSLGKSIQCLWTMDIHPTSLEGKNMILDTCQKILDGTFDGQNITGNIRIDLTENEYIEVYLDKGKITQVVYSNFEDKNVQNVVYMSPELRIFKNLDRYLVTRKGILGVEPRITSDDQTTELLKSYRLYDIQYVERLIASLPLKLEETTKDALKDFDEEVFKDIHLIGVDLDKCYFFLNIKKGDHKFEEKKIFLLGSGHQALLNMIIGSAL